jgi:hypothetical protein
MEVLIGHSTAIILASVDFQADVSNDGEVVGDDIFGNKGSNGVETVADVNVVDAANRE